MKTKGTSKKAAEKPRRTYTRRQPQELANTDPSLITSYKENLSSLVKTEEGRELADIMQKADPSLSDFSEDEKKMILNAADEGRLNFVGAFLRFLNVSSTQSHFTALELLLEIFVVASVDEILLGDLRRLLQEKKELLQL